MYVTSLFGTAQTAAATAGVSVFGSVWGGIDISVVQSV